MAHISRIVYLLLLPFMVNTLDNVCTRKLCECKKTKGNKPKVDCRDRGLKDIYAQDQFPSNMAVLDLSRNNISVIKLGFLDQHYKLERLYLRKNKIRTIERRAFVGLDGLKRLYMRGNRLVKLNKEAFLGVQKLDVLELGNNKIRSIDKDAFHGLINLTKLSLKTNNFTTIANGTFDQLISLNRLELNSVPLRCDCKLYPIVKVILNRADLKVLGKCSNRKEKLNELKGINLCEKPPDISINPSEDQIVSIGDSLIITCRATTKRKRELYWRKNHKPLPNVKNVKVVKDFSAKRALTFIKFSPIDVHDGGTYMCYSGDSDLIPKEIAIRVVSSKHKVCSRDEMMLDYEPILWPVTLERSTVTVSCPKLYSKGTEIGMRRTCSENGVWGPVNLGKCQMGSFPEKLIMLAESLKKYDFVDVAQVARRLRWWTNASEYQSPEYVTLAFDVFAAIIQKDVPFKGKFLQDVLTSFNNMMDVNNGTLYAAERKDQSPSRLGARLELISRRILNDSTSHALSNLVIDSLDLGNILSKESGTCKVFFGTSLHSKLPGVYCKPIRREDYSVSITIPKTILKDLKAVGHTVEDLKLQFLVYRNAKLFPNVISNVTERTMRNRNVSSGVLAIQMANILELNLTDPLIIQFATQAGTEPIISHFDLGEEVVGKQWFKSVDCTVKHSTPSVTTVECRRLVNKIFAVMSHLESSADVITVVYPVEIIVRVGAVVTSLILIIILVTFALARNVRFNRDDIIMLMNACLALLVVVLSFAFGIDRTESSFVCKAMGISMHFFFFASLLWLGSYVVCVTRRLIPRDKDASEEVLNPVLMYYMVSWGLPAIICGMTVAGDIKNYKTADYCWLTESAGLGAFVGPACLLFLINAVLLVRLHLILARGVVDQRQSEESTEEERLQADEPGVLEEVPDPSESQNAEKSAITLSLVATWVVMSLIYLNFILAYFLVNSRTSKVRWISLSYVYALANVALAVAIFGFHCVVRQEVREFWKLKWKQIRAAKFTFAPYRMWKARIRKQDTTLLNGRVILLNGQDVTHRIESDRQSNITLPSSAALTNDVFVNGRPMSTARLSLLDEADFPADETPHAEAMDNEVDITETGNSEENRRSQSSVHSERKSKTLGENATELSPCIPEVNEEKQNLLSLPAETPADHADITDGGVTSKSESSAPTTIEVSQAPARPDSPIAQIDPHAGMMRPFMVNPGRPFPPTNQGLYPGPLHQFRPVFQAPFSHQAVPIHHLQPANQGAPPNFQISPRQQVPPPHQTQPTVMEPAPPSYQKATEIASQSSSSFGEASVSRSNSKRKRSSESLGSRNESGSVGPRTRKLQQLQAQPSSSSAISEVPSTAQVPNRQSDSTNSHNPGASSSRPPNRYRDGRAKPEPKPWNGSLQRRIAYVPLPHVSKIHREPLHNETSV